MEEDSPYEIAVARVDGQTVLRDSLLIEAVRATLQRHTCPTARVSIALVNDARMAELNNRHLMHDGPTDVLTFDLKDSDDTNAGDLGDPLSVEGEIVISVETAVREAARRGHDPDAEAALYVVHGTLHLLGYDDADEEGAAAMHAAEDDILTAVGVGPVYRGAAR
ncbi:MAG: rRNA maturation RNase YbeY [Planctomycetes bacterium]|nr:rRNA maturation RNase YbeY [Planctomycetota bacterium]